MSPPPDEKAPDLAGSSPPRVPMTDFEVAVMLHKIKWELAAINAKLEKAEKNDERFSKMETHFNLAKWFAVIATVAGVGSLVTGVAARFSVRIVDAPAPVSSSAERLGPDRVVPPAPPPTSPPLQGR